MKNIVRFFLLSGMLVVASACSTLLDEIPDRKLAAPRSMKALRAMLDEDFAINGSANGLGNASADDYYLTEEDYAAIGLNQRNLYTWQDDIASEDSYMVMYRKINIANIVLEAIAELVEGTETQKSEIRGEALFVRAHTLLALTGIYTKQYDPMTADDELGLILRYSSDFNIASERSTLEETYNFIERDLLESVERLPAQSAHVFRPNKLVANALLARFYLYKQNYEIAEKYADNVLDTHSELMDYNDLDSTLRYPIPAFNKEILYQTHGATGFSFSARAKIDTLLVERYEKNDLRRSIFFFTNVDGSKRFKGSYFGGEQMFTGLALDEVYLTKAECSVRLGKFEEAVALMNRFLIKRYAKESFTELVLDEKNEVLNFILTERRKQLLMRELRWQDIKRLNTDERYKRNLERRIGSDEWSIESSSNRFALPLPQSVIDIAGVEQNPL